MVRSNSRSGFCIMSTGILNFNLQANVSALRTANSWSVTANLTPSFNSYAEVNGLSNGPLVYTNLLLNDIVKNASSNALYACRSNGIFQYT